MRDITEITEIIDTLAPGSLFGLTLNLEEHNWGGRRARFANPDMKLWLDRMAERGLTVPAWPVEHGGAGWSDADERLLKAELRRRRLPPPLIGLGLTMVGPAILEYGDPKQRERLLPPTAQGRIRWCQGFSEPEAGSDLPSLRTRAERRSDRFVVNGQKVWTSHADRSDWMIALVRTSSGPDRRSGISCLLIDMTTPGVSTRPIKLISGASPFCETFFDDVEVPTENLLGSLDSGWPIARFLLGKERTMLSGIAVGASKGSSLEDTARHYRGRDGMLPDHVRRALAQIEIEGHALRYLEAGLARRPVDPNMLKLASSELNQRRLELRQDLLGLHGMGWDGISNDGISGEGFSGDELRLSRAWLRSRAYTIEGGTSEVLLNAIAGGVLLLPREGAR